MKGKIQMKQFNEKLAKWLYATPSQEAGINNIQIPGDVEHLVWQNRSREPSQYELDFVQHLIEAFSRDVTELNALTEALNQQGFRTVAGERWNAENFSTEMQRLGH